MKKFSLLLLCAMLSACAGSPARQLLEGKSSIFDGTKTRKGFSKYYGYDIGVLFAQQGYPKSVLYCTKNGISRKIYVYQTNHYSYQDSYAGESYNTIYYQRDKVYTGSSSLTLVFTDEYDNVESVREINWLAGGRNQFMKTYGCVQADGGTKL